MIYRYVFVVHTNNIYRYWYVREIYKLFAVDMRRPWVSK